MEDLKCFVSVEFVDDPNVVGLTYWYLCDFIGAEAGDKVVAPLGRHNNLQEGVVRKKIFADEAHSPYPFDRIKRIRELKKEGDNVQNSN